MLLTRSQMKNPSIFVISKISDKKLFLKTHVEELTKELTFKLGVFF